ncbi:MAG: class I SAM-dependent RNA methyltransferase [Roseimicrobium sp.]
MRQPPKKFVPHPFPYHHELELTIEKLTNLGHGIARVDGWVVMIPFALPDEKVRARIHRNHKNYSEADLMEVREPSPNRVQPRCPLFGTCGGCQYQNLAYEAQLVWKQQQVAELLKHMARIEHEVLPVIASPRQFEYRSKITPHFAQPRDGKVAEIGFLADSSRHRIVDVPRCDIAMPELNEALGGMREDIRANASRYKRGDTVLLRASQGNVLTQSSQIAVEEVDGVRFEFQAGDFFQNNPFILPAFVQHVGAEAKASGARYLLDAYCGSGLFALTCAKHFEHVVGIEISESAIVKAKHNAEINGITNAQFTAGSAEHLFANAIHPAEETAVIVDPPRAGCDENFLSQLFAFGPRAVVYVSCNPATQMRDLQKFTEAGYTLKKVQPFDLFPQTRHLECVITLEKGDAAAAIQGE